MSWAKRVDPWQERRSWGLWGPDPLKICKRGQSMFWPLKMSHFFIQLLLLNNSAGFTSWKMKDLCQKWKEKLIFRVAWDSLMAWPNWPPTPLFIYLSTSLIHCEVSRLIEDDWRQDKQNKRVLAFRTEITVESVQENTVCCSGGSRHKTGCYAPKSLRLPSLLITHMLSQSPTGYQGRRSRGLGVLTLWKYVGWVRVCFEPLKCHILSFKTVVRYM